MKTKLLKKIRKRFTIEYYPLGVPNGNESYFDSKYLLTDYNNDWNEGLCTSKEECLYRILKIIRYEYKQYSRRYKNKEQQNKPIKVWWNN